MENNIFQEYASAELTTINWANVYLDGTNEQVSAQVIFRCGLLTCLLVDESPAHPRDA